MQKRTFLKFGGILAAGAFVGPTTACSAAKTSTALPTLYSKRLAPFELPPLPYSTDALEPNIDKMTMEIHHDKHHGAYVKNLNEAVKGTRFMDMDVRDIMAGLNATDPASIRNNGGGHFNHTMFWETLSPKGGGTPTGDLASAINAAFGSYDTFKTQFSTAAKGVFGSGWAWLSVGKDKKLFISSTPNQDNPLMANLVKLLGTPIMGLDVWEHAYYLKYQNKRADYITAFYNVVDWDKVNQRLAMGMK